MLVCMLQELGCLMESLSTTCATIVLDTHLSEYLVYCGLTPSVPEALHISSNIWTSVTYLCAIVL